MTFLREQLADHSVTLFGGDCRDILATLATNSIDSCVCDPPYHLTSIVKRFGSDSAAPAKVGKTGAYVRASAGFMGKTWDGGDITFQVDLWREVWRVLKPGAYLVAFCGTRTYHRMACAIEDAGFEIRDMISWLYGSGFPKSLDVSKAIDKAAGVKGAFGGAKTEAHQRYIEKGELRGDRGHEGWQRPWMDDPEAVANAGRQYIPATSEAEQWSGFGTALKPACEPIVLARKPLEGTVAANVLKWGTGALNIDGCRVGTEGATKRSHQKSYGPEGRADQGGSQNWRTGHDIVELNQGRWPANIIHDGSDEVVAAFPDSDSSRSVVTSKPGAVYGNGAGLPSHTGEYGFNDSGSAARFFYSAKADADDRLGSKHPTVKPLDLMQYLCRLVTPPRGLVLDPFAGTGTTGEAALREGMRAILIEREAEYQDDIRRRMKLAMSGPDERARESIKAKMKDKPIDAGPLFGGSDKSPEGGQADLRPLRRSGRAIGPTGLKR